ncbi:thioesterase [Effusibacillus lacus]|uniref:Thioesterase n=2 Tax=Effusibacillus lacus TaxID=1348429 RepID=A0A292YJH8_9BACL|nr:thioesterase [Effusibacillus lacus]
MASGDMLSLMKLLPIQRERHEDWYVMSLPLLPFFMNPLGIVHGGITAVLLDSAMGWSIAEETGKQVVTLQMNVNYIAPGKGKVLKVFARPTHTGRATAVAEAYMENETGKRIAQSTGTFYYTGEPAIRLEEQT